MRTEPYEQLNGEHPLYILQFDCEGELKSPQTLDRLLKELARQDYTQIYLFSHGWNNNFGDATRLYRRFFLLFLSLRTTYRSDAGDWRPVFIGLHWPSIVLNLPWERGLRFAGSTDDEEMDLFAIAKESVASLLDSARKARFYELTESQVLGEAESLELAELLLPIYTANALDTAAEITAPLSADGLVASWKDVPGTEPPVAPDYNRHGLIEDDATGAEPRAASAADFLDPRNAIRVTTVLMMKDRAGVIGRNGLVPLLTQLTTVSVPVHLIGHSFGARVCLTALSSPVLAGKVVESLLLLQPAVNQYCFAASIPGLGLMTKGGFVPALDRIAQPVYTTFSTKDIPLHAFFQLAARRPEDRGEIRYAAEGSSEFSALGGYGPAGLPASDFMEETIHPAGTRYQIPAGTKILALDGSAGEISGHGDVVSEYTCWALLDQEMGSSQ